MVAANVRWCVLVWIATCAASASGADGVSELWGRDGELWDRAGRLTDFSFAGYGRGERSIPDVQVVANVRQFGATGDGQHDDTDAFRRAIAETVRGAILIPPGKYVISDILDISKSGIVLRGSGPDQTTLYFPKFLNDVRPNMSRSGSSPRSNYSWSGGFIWVSGEFAGQTVAEVIQPARRGQRELMLSSTGGLKVGQEIELQQRDEPSNSLAEHLYGHQSGDISDLNGRMRSSLICRIVSIAGDRIVIDRGLRTDVDLRWQPRIDSFEPSVTDVGIESLRFEFPNIPYAGHFTELGHNAIAMQQVAHCWVRDIAIDNCDSGIFNSARFCTIDGVVFNSEREPDARGNRGHHGVTVSGEDNLFTRFRFNFKFIHDCTATAGAAGNVVCSGSGVDVCFDHHRRAPHANLFTDVDAGEGSRLWLSGGSQGLGQHTGAWATFWNIRTNQPQSWPPRDYGPDLMNLVGLRSDQPAMREAEGKWFEPAVAMGLQPANLYQAQLQRRRSHEH